MHQGIGKVEWKARLYLSNWKLQKLRNGFY
jgi:hypothetical protein